MVLPADDNAPLPWNPDEEVSEAIVTNSGTRVGNTVHNLQDPLRDEKVVWDPE
jgi:hypothetical protein